MNIALTEMKSSVSDAVSGMNTTVTEMKSCVNQAFSGLNTSMTEMKSSGCYSNECFCLRNEINGLSEKQIN